MTAPSTEGRSPGAPKFARLHHYVPRALLAAFTDTGSKGDGTLCVHPRERGRRAFRTGVGAVAAENGLHPSPEFEAAMSDAIEAPFFRWHKRLLHGPRFGLSGALEALTEEERVVIAQFVIVQQLRTPAERARSRRLGDVAFEEHMGLASTRSAIAQFYRERVAPKAPRTRRQRKADVDDFQVRSRRIARFLSERRRHQWLNPLGRFAAKATPLVLDREWRLVELPEDVAARHPLITCDDPVVLVRPRRAPTARGRPTGPGWDVDLGGGWDEPGVQATLTLSPRHALLMSRDPDAFALAREPEQFARALRVRTARSAMEWAYARDEDQEVLDILRTTPRPHVQLVVGGIPFGPEVDASTITTTADLIGVNAIEVRRAG